MTKLRRLFLILLMTILAGCGYETLYSNLDEQQANEMLALLLSHGIDAKKTGLDKSWNLQTPRNEIPRAIQLLKNEGFPRESFESLGDVFKKEGFVSSPMEERARLLHALSQELSNTLSAIDGVITARVHLAIPERRVLEENTAPSSASVFIKHRSGADVQNQTAAIKALVVNSIEGLLYDNVTVTFFVTRADLPKPQPTETVKLAEIPLMSLGLSGLVFLAFFVYFGFKRTKAHKTRALMRR
ncbi:MAG: type III secretion inner membrane ring lipoprotein SctJ [Pseudomonadota bacterium]